MFVDIPDAPGFSWFAVFDGHGGNLTSATAARHLLDKVKATDHFKRDLGNVENLEAAIRQGFMDVDVFMRTVSQVSTCIWHCRSKLCVCARPSFCSKPMGHLQKALTEAAPQPLQRSSRPRISSWATVVIHARFWYIADHGYFAVSVYCIALVRHAAGARRQSGRNVSRSQAIQRSRTETH